MYYGLYVNRHGIGDIVSEKKRYAFRSNREKTY